MRLDRITLHSWDREELTIRSEEDWVLGFYRDDQPVGPGIVRIPVSKRPTYSDNDYTKVVNHVLCVVCDLIKVHENELRYVEDILKSVLPFML